jgi:glycerol-3-phosphate dehydrogenase (NAD(P)+)
MANLFILGCGFGTSLAVLWDKAGHDVTAYSNSAEEITAIVRDREHKKLLPGVHIPESIKFTTELAQVNDADIVVFAVPSKFVEQVAAEAAPYIKPDTMIVNVGKGFSKSCKFCRFSQTIGRELPNNRLVVLTGPCHAEEVGRGCPTTVVAASRERKASEHIQSMLSTKTLRIYVNDDIIGCELGGTLKNPIALCCGIASGMGLGDNAAAALVTRGLAEMTRLGVVLGAKETTFSGLAGVGDLIVTCISKHSRNNRAGVLIGCGVPAEEAVAQIGTVEGYECVKIAVALAKEHGIEVPIFEQLYRICYEGLSPEEALDSLMERPFKSE